MACIEQLSWHAVSQYSLVSWHSFIHLVRCILQGPSKALHLCRSVSCLKCQKKCVTYSIAQPLYSRDGDGPIKGAGPQREPIAQIMQAQVPLNLPLTGNIQHCFADVHALKSARLHVRYPCMS